jgi:GDPmannose 4,6-dehydratase
MKKALITGVTGQDGSYLAEFLIEKGYEVHGLVRRSSTNNLSRINFLLENDNFNLVYGDLEDSQNIHKIIIDLMPDEIYNLGALSYVGLSFELPSYTLNVDAGGFLRILEAVRHIKENEKKSIKVYQASTSEMFGKVIESPQTEKTPFYPRSPYGCAKVAAHYLGINYRESYDLFICHGILFNHESPRRGEEFVTRKITKGIAEIKKGKRNFISLGNLDSKRDWGHAKDYVEAMWLMMQQDVPMDFVISTGETHSVREFLEVAFKSVEIEIESNRKEGIEEEYVRKDNGAVVVKINPKFYRPSDVDFLLGDSSKVKKILGWEPKIKFKELINEMIESDLNNL